MRTYESVLRKIPSFITQTNKQEMISIVLGH